MRFNKWFKQKMLLKLSKKACVSMLLLPTSLAFSNNSPNPDLETYHKDVEPLLKKYCHQCHGERKSKADIRFDTMDPNILTGEDGGKWEDALQQFNIGDMPPEDEEQPTDHEREIISSWLNKEFKKASLMGRNELSKQVRRLTRYELKHTLEDLLQTSISKSIEKLPEESQSTETGLKNNSSLLMVSSPYIESYLDTIFTTIEKTKRLIHLETFSTQLNLAQIEIKEAGPLYLDSDSNEKKKDKAVKKKKAKKQSKAKPAFAKAELVNNKLLLEGNGHMTLNIPYLPKGLFNVPVTLKSTSTAPYGELELYIGFKFSQRDRREVLQLLGRRELQPTKETQTINFEIDPAILTDTISRSEGREYFVRIINKSRPIAVQSFEFFGNINQNIKHAIQKPNEPIKESITSFLTKAYRRSPSENEIKKYFKIYSEFVKTEKSTLALLSTYEEILCSPNFLYLGLTNDTHEKLDKNFRLAEKLSYFLWSSIPDQALMEDAQKLKLTEPAILKSHVQRMLKDEKAKRFVENYTEQCLDTEKLFNVAVNGNYYKGFKDTLKPLMKQETIEAINDVFRNGASALNLLKADHVFVNGVLAKFYDIKGVNGSMFRKVPVSEKDKRGGLLTQGTFLIGNSDGINSHAILRGVWLTSIMLNSPPPEPPKNVPPLDETIPGFNKMTLNQKMEAHRNNDACRSCHNKIDPWGMPFENYDASGAWRDKVLMITEGEKKGKKQTFDKSFVKIERKSTLPSKDKIDGMLELKNHLMAHRKEDFAKGLTERLLSYALSRDVDFYDKELVEDLNHKFINSDYSVIALIEEIVLSHAFKKEFL